MAAETRSLPDHDARRTAATDFSRNLVVRAGAGTGKTSLLVERALNAIGSGVAGLDRLAAITFTEKAAGEMRGRLALGLDRLRLLGRGEVELDPREEADRAWVWLTGQAGVEPATVVERALEGMRQIDAGSVSTIHAFCAELLRSHPVEAGVDPDFLVDSGEHTTSLRLESWERFLTEELGPKGRHGERAGEWKRLLGAVPLSLMRELAASLSGFDVPLDLLEPPHGQPAAAAALRGIAGRMVERIDAVLSRQSGLSPAPLAFLEGLSEALTRLGDEGLDAFRARIEANGNLRERIVDDKSVPKANKKLVGVPARELDALLSELRGTARALYRVDDERIGRLVGIVAPFARSLRETCLEAGIIGFDGLLVLARDLLRDHRGVRRRVKERHHLLFVDEFQDTDPVQYEIVLFLAEELGEETESAFDARLAPGRLFVVGDAKQSIYRFRGADYAAYRRAIDRIRDTGGLLLDLTGNFRSVSGIVDPVNRVFRGGWWDPSGYQPEYVPIEAMRDPGDSTPRVEIWSVSTDRKQLADERREGEGRLIAEAIRRLVDEGRCSYRGITILFRAFSSIEHYLRPLRQWGIPFVVDGGREFLSRPEVTQLIATLRALAQPADPVARLAYLRSPAGAVADTELAAYAENVGRPFRLRDTDPARYPRIAAALTCLDELAEQTRHAPSDAVVRAVLERTLLLPLGAAAFEGPQRVANLRKLSAAAADLARDGKLCLEEVIDALQEGRLEDIHTDRPLADDAAEAVRITSIHRMKGLENDWIFLPDLARGEGRPRDATPTARPSRLPDGGPALAVRVGDDTNSAGAWHEHEHRLHEAAEEKRVLYVAMTRAREQLILVAGQTKARAPSWVEALSPWGFQADDRPDDGAVLSDGEVLHRVLRIPSAPRAEPDSAAPEADAAGRRYELALDSARERSRPALAVPSDLGHGEDEAPRSDRPLPVGRNVARAVGTAVHRVLERGDGSAAELAAACAGIAARSEVDEAALVAECRPLLEAFVASPLMRRLGEISVLGREVPMLFRDEEGRAWRGSIDLLYRDLEGRLVVADYKTDRDTDPDRLRERYARQLRVYARAAAAALGVDAARAELWVLRSGERVEI